MNENTERNIFLTSVIIVAVIAFLYHRKKYTNVPVSSLGQVAAENAGVSVPQAGSQPVFTPSELTSEDYPTDATIPSQSFYVPSSAPVSSLSSGCGCGGSGGCGTNGAPIVSGVSSLLSSLANPSNPIVAAFFNGQ